MIHKTTLWKVGDLYKKRDQIQFPEYQREPNVWTEEKRATLIDSIIQRIPIPPIFLFEQSKGMFDCVDGRQRIESIIQFFDGGLEVNNQTINSMTEKMIQAIEEYELTITVIKEADDKDLRLTFQRLQLGAPLNAGEKLNASTGEMKDFVFNTAKAHPFFKNISIPTRRFSKEQVLAQICLNSFGRTMKKGYQSARYEKLKAFFEQHEVLDKYRGEIRRIKDTLDLLHEAFGEKARNLTNRALVLTAYLFVEDLLGTNRRQQAKIFADFYLKFIKIMKAQAKKGLDYDKHFRKVVDFYSHVTQAAFEPYSIERREKLIEEFFEYYLRYKEIKKDKA